MKYAIPVHPGEILQDELQARNLTQTALARHLGVDPSKINDICRGRRGISAEMAVQLAKAFDTSPGLWLNLQKNYELSRVDEKKYKIKPLPSSSLVETGHK